jgi:hypothetical protein
MTSKLRLLFLYNVAESIRLDTLRQLLGPKASETKPTAGSRSSEYARFESAPAVEELEGSKLLGETIAARRKYHDIGIITIELTVQIEGEWDSLVARVSRLVNADEFDNYATQLRSEAQKAAGASLVKPYSRWIDEEYFILEIEAPTDKTCPSAQELLTRHGAEIAQIVRGDETPLSDAERQEVLQSSISYSRNDLLAVGWQGALVYETGDGIEATAQLLEYANIQLVEFRHYDDLLTRVLDEVYQSLERKGRLAAWRLSREASRLNTLRLDVMELTEKADNALKFVSDMFYARLYRLAAARIGVSDYRNLVDEKLRTAGELYKFMVDQFDESRSFILELAIVIILIIDMWVLFGGGG